MIEKKEEWSESERIPFRKAIPNGAPASDSISSAELESTAYLQNLIQELQAQSLRQILVLREKYSGRVFGYTVSWTVFCGLLLIADSIPILNPYFNIDTNVMLGILTTTTVSVIGLVLTLIKGLFPSHGD